MSSIPLLTISKTSADSSNTFDIFPADKLIIRGPSGCGKSSLARLIGGLKLNHKIDFTIKWHGDKKPSISYLDQNSWSVGLTLKEEISFYEHEYFISSDRLAKASFCADISDDPLHFLPNKPFDTYSSNSKLSGGQLRRLSLARVLYIDSDMILLDEPTASLHQSSKDCILNRIATHFPTQTIINISHDSYNAHDTYRVIDL